MFEGGKICWPPLFGFWVGPWPDWPPWIRQWFYTSSPEPPTSLPSEGYSNGTGGSREEPGSLHRYRAKVPKTNHSRSQQSLANTLHDSDIVPANQQVYAALAVQDPSSSPPSIQKHCLGTLQPDRPETGTCPWPWVTKKGSELNNLSYTTAAWAAGTETASPVT